MLERTSQGFTLIEMIIAMAVIAGMAAIAIPSYQNHIIRTELAEGLHIMGQHTKKMINYYYKHGAWPESGDTGSLSLSGFNKSYMRFEGGSQQQVRGDQTVLMVYTKFGKRIAAYMQPHINNGTISIRCGPSNYTKRDNLHIYLPDTCRDDVLSFSDYAM